MTAIDLTTHPVVQTPNEGRWQSLTGPLGLTAFGVNACIMDPGETLDISHTEDASQQQELFIVVAGKMEITLDGEKTIATPGTVVGISNITVRRDYRALEPGTRMVCVGARPSAENKGFGSWITPA